jgi:thioredoxin-like negative regulator of GroEL
MQDLLARLGILALAMVLVWLAVWAVRRFIDSERRRALSAAPVLSAAAEASWVKVRILAFSSETCRPCHTLQRPALEAITAQHGDAVAVTWIDAPTSPELTERFHVLTVPTTVVLDAQNQVQAINYGFAPTNRLLEQINAILARSQLDTYIGRQNTVRQEA